MSYLIIKITLGSLSLFLPTELQRSVLDGCLYWGVLLKAIMLHILRCYLKKSLYIDYLKRPMDKNRMEEDTYSKLSDTLPTLYFLKHRKNYFFLFYFKLFPDMMI